MHSQMTSSSTSNHLSLVHSIICPLPAVAEVVCIMRCFSRGVSGMDSVRTDLNMSVIYLVHGIPMVIAHAQFLSFSLRKGAKYIP